VELNFAFASVAVRNKKDAFVAHPVQHRMGAVASPF
jgi:hypothetical protein